MGAAIRQELADGKSGHRGVWDKFLEVLKTGVPVTHEHFYAHEQFDGWFLQTIAKANDGILLSTLDITDRKRTDIALRQSEERFRQFAASSSDALWIRDAETFAFEYVSPAIEPIFGVTPDDVLAEPRLLNALILPEERDAVSARIARIAGGEELVNEYRILRPTDGTFRWIRSNGFPLRDEHGRVNRIAAIASDITAAKLADEHQGVLLAELQHRVRNIMAMLRSITNRTAGGAISVENYRELLSGRLMALSRVQALLTRQANTGASLRSIIESEIIAQAQHRGQYELTGPDIMLSPKAVEVLTLAFHELATNALKYGALSVPAGRVTVRWNTAEKRGEPWLALDWIENGAPPRQAVTRRGFGSELIEARIPYELGGSGKVTIEPVGARCRLELPLRDGGSILETGAPEPVSIFGGSLDMTGAPDLSGQSILVVEDDYYIAWDTSAALRGAGAHVIGPCPSEEAAQRLLVAETITGAVIDLNLGGTGPRFEIARALRQRGIPFVFLTGYDAEVIRQEFSEVERLEKPVPLGDVVGAMAKLIVRPSGTDSAVTHAD